MVAVIMAGGKGTRIETINNIVPKPMIPIMGKPILEHQIEHLKKQGINKYFLIVGHKKEYIKNYFDNGSKWNVCIDYVEEQEPLGTAGGLFYLKNVIREDFLLINGDIIFDINLQRFFDYHREKGGEVTIVTHPNDHPYDSALIVSDSKGLVRKWIHKEEERNFHRNQVNAGIHLCAASLLNRFYEPKKLDFDRDILKDVIVEKKLYVYQTPEYIKDMGTPQRYLEVIKDMEKNKLFFKNLNNKQRAIFLDRDGTINKYVGFLRKQEQLELIDGVSQAIKKINQSGFLAIIVTNQPVIARGEVTEGELELFHNKLETLLGKEHAYVDDIFICPHHPDSGFVGERKEYKIQCECRKPNIGMMTEAAYKYNIDLSKSYMIGDSEIDILAGKKATCTTIKIGDKTQKIKPDYYAKNLLEAISIVEEKEKWD